MHPSRIPIIRKPKCSFSKCFVRTFVSLHIHTPQSYVVTAEFVYPGARMEKNALLRSRRYPSSRYYYPAYVPIASIVFYFSSFFFLSFYDPSFRKGIDRLVGNLLKIGSLLFSHRRSSWNAHEHPRSIKSPLANGTRGVREIFFLKKDETNIVSKIYDRFLL